MRSGHESFHDGGSQSSSDDLLRGLLMLETIPWNCTRAQFVECRVKSLQAVSIETLVRTIGVTEFHKVILPGISESRQEMANPGVHRAAERRPTKHISTPETSLGNGSAFRDRCSLRELIVMAIPLQPSSFTLSLSQ
jgi:hypothetical protein